VKKIQAVLIIVVIALTASLVAIGKFRRPAAAQFCSGSAKVSLDRIEFQGQGRSVVLEDTPSLEYLASLQKLEALPVDVKIKDGLSFNAKLFDSRGEIGKVEFFVSSDTKVISFGYAKSFFDDVSISYALVNSNVPPILKKTLAFLLADRADMSTGSTTNR
jgi:hypothetical protein